MNIIPYHNIIGKIFDSNNYGKFIVENFCYTIDNKIKNIKPHEAFLQLDFY